MHIAFLTPEYPHPNTGHSGGIGTSIKNLAIGLLAQKCKVRVLVYGQREDAIFEDEGICIQQIKNIKCKGLSWWLTRKKIQTITNQLYEAREIDVIEAPDWTGITSFITPKKCPIVIRLHGSDTYFCHLDKRPVKWINKFHEKRGLQNADGLLSVSQYTADITNAVFGLDKKFTIIPNPIDTLLFRSNAENSNEEKSILYFGSLIRKKGLLELPLIFNKVVEKNPKAKLVLVGKDVPDIATGNYSTWDMMQALFSEQAKDQVSYLGSIPYAEIKAKIAEATLCVFPSFAEAFPVSWLEAMAMGKPIVASNIGWATEMIDDGKSGYLVDPRDHNLFAGKIIDLLKDEQLRLDMSKEARNRVESIFDIQKIALQNVKYYRGIIAKSLN
ncbi:glycosyltransferase family 4 protein [Flavobacterium sp.]|jgi:glycosyltransferase involved in cell wall biosynthesis|uniref:glycosyltransferase family 4 protein n=1 Tax=Flavobacterium sp. TaxID=239 RepID=UPI0022CCD093|nr:glycosyltransferase family 4 protein [Flavobacterium sp.]MCZ8229356.1 glycosyltransferase family 4 protein [Flavobacterium sp.]